MDEEIKERDMQPVQAYEILKEQLTSQDSLIRQKVLGLFIANSVLLVAFFMSTSTGNFEVFRLVLVLIAIVLCLGLVLSLSFDIRAKWRSIDGLKKIEKAPDFTYLKGIQSRPITDIEQGARLQVKYRWMVKIPDFFWPLLPALFLCVWVLALKAG